MAATGTNHRAARRRVLLSAAALLSAGRFASADRRIAVTLRKFEIVPSELHVAAGDAVLLALTAIDFVHGFAVPELGLRTDVPVGGSVELALPPTRSGRYTILCDNFCGDGHDRMMGWLIVRPNP